jgi:hypothetical protein
MCCRAPLRPSMIVMIRSFGPAWSMSASVSLAYSWAFSTAIKSAGDVVSASADGAVLPGGDWGRPGSNEVTPRGDSGTEIGGRVAGRSAIPARQTAKPATVVPNRLAVARYAKIRRYAGSGFRLKPSGAERSSIGMARTSRIASGDHSTLKAAKLAPRHSPPRILKPARWRRCAAARR